MKSVKIILCLLLFLGLGGCGEPSVVSSAASEGTALFSLETSELEAVTLSGYSEEPSVELSPGDPRAAEVITKLNSFRYDKELGKKKGVADHEFLIRLRLSGKSEPISVELGSSYVYYDGVGYRSADENHFPRSWRFSLLGLEDSDPFDPARESPGDALFAYPDSKIERIELRNCFYYPERTKEITGREAIQEIIERLNAFRYVENLAAPDTSRPVDCELNLVYTDGQKSGWIGLGGRTVLYQETLYNAELGGHSIFPPQWLDKVLYEMSR